MKVVTTVVAKVEMKVENWVAIKVETTAEK